MSALRSSNSWKEWKAQDGILSKNAWTDASREASLASRRGRAKSKAPSAKGVGTKKESVTPSQKSADLRKQATDFWKGKSAREERMGVRTKKGEITHVKTAQGWKPVGIGQSTGQVKAAHAGTASPMAKATTPGTASPMAKATTPAHAATGGKGAAPTHTPSPGNHIPPSTPKGAPKAKTPVSPAVREARSQAAVDRGTAEQFDRTETHEFARRKKDNQGDDEDQKKKGTANMAKKWIQGAIKRPGALHKSLGVKKGEPIPEGKLDEASKKGGKVGARARLAKTLKSLHHNMVRNKSNEFNVLVGNIGGAKTRTDTLEGREYMVVPMVMITEGVHNGSNGPLYYPKEELGKTPVAWDHKPIVVYHPEENGQGISACLPAVLNTRKVGLILNTSWEDGKLRSEAWLDKERLKKVDNRVVEALDKGQAVEVSTGLFTDNEAKEGEWNQEKYVAIARNYRPDHLAILPDLKGSCSIEDGAGLLRNADVTHDHKRGLLTRALKEKQNTWSYPEDMTGDRVIYTDKDGKLVHEGYSVDSGGTKATLKGDPEEIHRKTQYCTPDGKVVANVIGKGVDEVDDPPDPKKVAPVVDEQDQAAIDENYSFEKKARKILKKGSSRKESKDQARFGKQAGITHGKEQTMKKSEMIDALVGNEGGLWVEADRGFLEAQPVERLEVFLQVNKELDEGEGQEEENAGNRSGIDAGAAFSSEEDNVGPKKDAKPKSKKKKALGSAEGVTTQAAEKKEEEMADEDEEDTRNVETEQPSVEDYVANAPPAIREVLAHGVRAHAAQKSKLIKVITSNARNQYPAEVLKKKSMDELQAIAALASPDKKPVANYSGLGWGESGAGTFPSASETPLELPVLNFEQKK